MRGEQVTGEHSREVAQCREDRYHRGPQDYGPLSGFGQGGAITIVFAPGRLLLEQILKTVEIQLQNRGAKDLVHNNLTTRVFAT